MEYSPIVDKLRVRMLESFNEYQHSPVGSQKRYESWTQYCYLREAFLQQKCHEEGRPYVTLKEQIIEVQGEIK